MPKASKALEISSRGAGTSIFAGHSFPKGQYPRGALLAATPLPVFGPRRARCPSTILTWSFGSSTFRGASNLPSCHSHETRE